MHLEKYYQNSFDNSTPTFDAIAFSLLGQSGGVTGACGTGSGKATIVGAIYYSKTGAYIVPANPK